MKLCYFLVRRKPRKLKILSTFNIVITWPFSRQKHLKFPHCLRAAYKTVCATLPLIRLKIHVNGRVRGWCVLHLGSEKQLKNCPLPIFPARLLTTTMSPPCCCSMYGRTAFVMDIVPKRFSSKRALSTSRGVSFIKASWPRAPLLTKTST